MEPKYGPSAIALCQRWSPCFERFTQRAQLFTVLFKIQNSCTKWLLEYHKLPNCRNNGNVNIIWLSNSVCRHEMWNDGHSCMKCTPWITSFKNSGWRYRYLSTKANVILLVSWPANSISKMLSLMSSTLMKLPSSIGMVSKTERRSWLAEAFPSFKSCTQNSSCHPNCLIS